MVGLPRLNVGELTHVRFTCVSEMLKKRGQESFARQRHRRLLHMNSQRPSAGRWGRAERRAEGGRATLSYMLYPTLHRLSLMEWEGREAVGVGSSQEGGGALAVTSVDGVVHTLSVCESHRNCPSSVLSSPSPPGIIPHKRSN